MIARKRFPTPFLCHPHHFKSPLFGGLTASRTRHKREGFLVVKVGGASAAARDLGRVSRAAGPLYLRNHVSWSSQMGPPLVPRQNRPPKRSNPLRKGSEETPRFHREAILLLNATRRSIPPQWEGVNSALQTSMGASSGPLFGGGSPDPRPTAAPAGSRAGHERALIGTSGTRPGPAWRRACPCADAARASPRSA